MIVRLVVALLLVWLSPAAAAWHSVLQVSIASAPAGYTGPGDAVPSAAMWWGLRGYNTAFTGNVANICDSATGLVCADVTWSGTALVMPTIGGVACNNVGNICKVKILYDQTGNGFHLNNNARAVGTWPTLTLSCIGTFPCMTFTSASSQCLNSTGNFSQAGPTSMEFVGARTANFTTAQRAISLASGIGSRNVGWTTSASTLGGGGGLPSLGSIADSAFHAAQFVLNDAASSSNADGTSASGTVTGTIGSATAGFGGNQICTAQFIDGQLTEGGVWPVAFSAGNITDLNTNAHSYWGF